MKKLTNKRKKNPNLKLYVEAEGDPTGDIQYACITLSREQAKQLLTYRDVFQQTSKLLDASLWAIEFFNYICVWGDCVSDTGARMPFTVWYTCRGIRFIDKHADLCTLQIMDDGVCWTATPKHDTCTVTTPELYWSQLEEIARTGKLKKDRSI